MRHCGQSTIDFDHCQPSRDLHIQLGGLFLLRLQFRRQRSEPFCEGRVVLLHLGGSDEAAWSQHKTLRLNLLIFHRLAEAGHIFVIIAAFAPWSGGSTKSSPAGR